MCSSRWKGRPALTIALALLFVVVIVLLTGCDLSPAQPTTAPGVPTEPPAPSQPTAMPTPAADTTPVPTVITLTVWTTEVFSPTEAITSGQVLAQQVADLEETFPNVRLQFVLKQSYGKGGMLDYLLTTQAAVPALLPDLAIIDMDELRVAVQAGVVQPLDDLLPVELVTDLYPAAREAATFDGRLYALQFLADLEHLVYNTGKMTVPPRSWPGVLSNPGPYVFPAGGVAGLVNDAFLIQYMAAQPTSSGEASQGLLLDEDPLAAVLQYYQDGMSRGVFPASVLGYHTTDDSWQDYLSGDASLSHVSAHRYLSDRAGLQGTALAPIPAIDGPAEAINRGWGLILVTSDPVRQSAAARFMIYMLSPQTSADWTLAADYLPTRQTALALWDQGDSFVPFAHQQLLAAQPRPVIANYTKVAAAMQVAVVNILTGAATPEEAAAQIIQDSK
jgi:ABC-type glycerol-3-phosphate transport system substrate-binding protein